MIAIRVLDRLIGSGGGKVLDGMEKVPQCLQHQVREITTMSGYLEQNLVAIEQILFGETIR